MTTEFSQLNLHPQIMQAVTELGYTEPTPIQSGIIPLMLAGHDVLGQAQTGTGKTAAFALPILQSIEPGLGHVQALIMAPTRELAMQVSKAIYDYGRYRGVRVLSILTELGYTEPTPIQSAMIPLMLAGHDVLGQAQTGTGKTAAFALPILHNIEPGRGDVQALIVAPTRELALQVSKAIYDYGRYREIRVLIHLWRAAIRPSNQPPQKRG